MLKSPLVKVPSTQFPSAAFPCRLHPLVVSAKYQRRHRPPPRDHQHEEDEIGGVGFAVLSAIKSDPRPKTSHSPTQARPVQQISPHEPIRDEKGPVGSLSGSEILHALQRAATKKKKKKKNKVQSGKGRGSTGAAAGGIDVSDSEEDVRPLNIKKDWAVRLEEMERAVEELLRLEA